MAASTGRQCKATTKRGEPCASYAVEGSDFCYWHAPELAESRKLARSNGGRARHGRKLGAAGTGTPVKLASLADVVRLVEGAVGDVLELENSIARARAVGYLAGIAVKALEVSELEQRIVQLEQRMEAQNGIKGTES